MTTTSLAKASLLARVAVAGLAPMVAVGLSAGMLVGVSGVEAQVFRSASVGVSGAPGGGRTITGPMLEKYVGVLGFDASQRDAAKTFHEEYQRRAAEGDKVAADARKKMKEMMEDGDHEAAMKKMGEMMGESQKIKAEASVQFLANLKEVLTEGQAPAWERFERLRRRESLGGGGLGLFVCCVVGFGLLFD